MGNSNEKIEHDTSSHNHPHLHHNHKHKHASLKHNHLDQNLEHFLKVFLFF